MHIRYGICDRPGLRPSKSRRQLSGHPAFKNGAVVVVVTEVYRSAANLSNLYGLPVVMVRRTGKKKGRAFVLTGESLHNAHLSTRGSVLKR